MKSIRYIIFIFFALTPFLVFAQRTLSKKAAKEFGKIAIYYNNRISTINTFSIDFTQKITGKHTYNNLNAVQIFSGWLFFPQEWENEPMIKLKNKVIRSKLNHIAGSKNKNVNLKFTDFFYPEGTYRLPYLNVELTDKAAIEADEKINLILSVINGEILKIFPHKNNWLSITDNLQDVKTNDTVFIANVMPLLMEELYNENEETAIEIINKIIKFQIIKTNGEVNETKTNVEILYNNLNRTDIAYKIALFFAVIGLLNLLISNIRGSKQNKFIHIIILVVAVCITLWLSAMLAARVYLTGHLPLSNGYETMIFAAWLSVLITLVLRAKEFLFVGGLLISGIAMLVSYISGLNPMMTSLVPVLQSPLLTIHVSLIMLAYCLLAFIALNSMIALILKFVTGNFNTQFEILSCKMLLIAVLLMGCGIFVGAIWANNSWGRYWGWDPKEVWALITFIIYGLALYGNNIQFFKRPAVFHTYLLLAFGSVLMTYLGVNIFLGGIHSY